MVPRRPRYRATTFAKSATTNSHSIARSRRCLRPKLLADSRFPTLLSAILGEDDPDLSPLGIGPTELQLLQAGGTQELSRCDREPFGRSLGGRSVPLDSQGSGVRARRRPSRSFREARGRRRSASATRRPLPRRAIRGSAAPSAAGRLPAEVATSSRLSELRRCDPRFVRPDAVHLLRVHTIARSVRGLRYRLAVDRHRRQQVRDGMRLRRGREGVATRARASLSRT